MSAYWKSIEHHCKDCHKPATAEVFNTFNASMGLLRCSCPICCNRSTSKRCCRGAATAAPRSQ